MTLKQAKSAYRDHQILRFIAGHHRANGYGPSFAEIGTHVGLASGCGIRSVLSKLRARDLVRWRDRCARSIETTGRTQYYRAEYKHGVKYPKLREI